MRNNKGFTLMELVAAIFIGGMVTAALVLVWKVSSVQTSQNQRQTIIRNQLSNFQRQLYKDFYESDIITYPDSTHSGSNMILAGIKKTSSFNLSTEKFTSDVANTTAFYYCKSSNVSTTILRYTESITSSGEQSISNYGSDKLSACRSGGKVVLEDFYPTNISIEGSLYNLQGRVQRTFNTAAGSTPINITVDEKLSIPGGFL
jgi:prepilin-type N-terminal cleavage/methylation domain-containing protein